MEASFSAKQYARAERKERVRALNEPPHLTVGEEIFNAVSHGAGAVLAVAAMTVLLAKAPDGPAVLAACVYGGSMIFMMLSSCLYHAMPARSGVKRLLRRFDYTSIYLLIGGTFAPLLLVYLGGELGVTLFCVQWGVIAVGVTLVAVFGPGRFRPLHFTLYFLIGWSGVMLLPDFYRSNRPLLWCILMGGVVYTAGMIPFARSRKYDHCVWHLFVLTAAALQWIGIVRFLY
ncbi:hemolysin III family protein [Oscillibacter sp.]|uniref:PAQR family membrane homeostasis protein TrhA n=1 Tax=Oscillibacter sp. TaxID=1945593 RepID=UPI002607E956|nr:hemolysin III family protein [Oscillibacter sp.]MDD3347478.1 hemolysin III family protein [Oscillibacter sp.]